MRATVAEKREVARETLMLVFDLQGEEVDFEPGHYFFVNLVDPPYDDEKGTRRHFSVVTSPTERGVLGFCTRLRDSAFKRAIRELQVGDEVDVEQPKGKFVLPGRDAGELAFVAGGIGITVFRCMLRYLADADPDRRVTLFYSNTAEENAAFLDEVRELEARLPGLTVVLTMTDQPDWDGETRFLSPAVFREYLGDRYDATTFMLAGTPAMATALKDALVEDGVPEERVLTDSFSGY